MTDRYHVPELTKASAGQVLTLPPDESSHAVRVMRIKPDATITLFSGRDEVATATVVTADRRSVAVRVGQVIIDPNVPDARVRVWAALPKPERCKELVARLTELGVTTITPILCERTQRPPSDNLLDKLRRGVVEACKQSRRNRLMEIQNPVAWSQVEPVRDELNWIAHPGGPPVQEVGEGPRCNVAIGPEGGFTDGEADRAVAKGWTPVGLGSRIYRIETAAVVMAALAVHRPR